MSDTDILQTICKRRLLYFAPHTSPLLLTQRPSNLVHSLNSAHRITHISNLAMQSAVEQRCNSQLPCGVSSLNGRSNPAIWPINNSIIYLWSDGEVDSPFAYSEVVLWNVIARRNVEGTLQGQGYVGFFILIKILWLGDTNLPERSVGDSEVQVSRFD